MSKKFDDVLDDCLERIANGERLEACLDDYPQYRQQLIPLLQMARATANVAAIVSPESDAKAPQLSAVHPGHTHGPAVSASIAMALGSLVPGGPTHCHRCGRNSTSGYGCRSHYRGLIRQRSRRLALLGKDDQGVDPAETFAVGCQQGRGVRASGYRPRKRDASPGETGQICRCRIRHEAHEQTPGTLGQLRRRRR